MPFSVHDNVDHPLSLYAATKKANELMAHTYGIMTCYDWTPLFYRIWSLGSPRHGLTNICPSYH